MIEFGKRLKLLRLNKDMSLEELSKHVDSTKSTISKYERGLIYPTLEVAKKISDYLGVTLDWLSGNGDINNPDKGMVDIKKIASSLNVEKSYVTVIKNAINMGFTSYELEEMIESMDKMKSIKRSDIE